ncbi:MAG TPA: cyclic nucleotide-binding domain-containing protein, partial [Kofleriaceae bacterium]
MADERTAEMYPTLSEAQIERIRPFGHERALHAGEVVYEQGEPASKFFVVLDGEIEVVHPYG